MPDFSNTGARAPTSAEWTSCLLAWRAVQFGCTLWIYHGSLLLTVFFFFFYQYMPHLKMSSSSFLAELFDPDLWPVRFFLPVSNEACRWRRLWIHLPCFYVTMKKCIYIYIYIRVSDFIYSSEDFKWLSCSIVVFIVEIVFLIPGFVYVNVSLESIVREDLKFQQVIFCIYK